MNSSFPTPVRRGAMLLAGLLAPLVSPAFEYNARLDYTWTENLGLATGAADFHDAATYAAGLTAHRAQQLAPNLLLFTTAEGTLSVTTDHARLTFGEISPRIGLQRKFGLGPTAPVLLGDVARLGRLARLDESTGLGGRATATYAKRFNPILAVAARGEFEFRRSRGDVYNTRHHSLAAEVSLDPHPRVRLTTGYGQRRGLIFAGASGARFAGALAGGLGPEIAAYYNRIPVSINHALERNWTTYRVKAEVNFWYFEFSPALTDRSALALRYERNSAINIVAVPYHRDLLTLSWLHAF